MFGRKPKPPMNAPDWPHDSVVVPAYNIRFGVQSDLAAMSAIDSMSYEQPLDQFQLAKVGRHGSVVTQVAEIKGAWRIMGFVMAQGKANPTVYEIIRLAVHPEWRRRGVGTRLLDSILHRLDSTQAKLIVDVCEDDLNAAKFLAACGLESKLMRGQFGQGGDGIRFTGHRLRDCGDGGMA